MYWVDSYADKYQKIQGFKIIILEKDNKKIEAYLSMKPSTRSTYDIAMRDATIDGLVTMDDISLLKPSQLFYKEVDPTGIFIIQAVNKLEQQEKSKNINAIKQNSYVTILRKQYDKTEKKELYSIIYDDVISFVSMQNKDEKNFTPGTEDNTVVNIQIPRKNFVSDILYDVKMQDRILLQDFGKTRKENIKIESVDAYGVPGVLRIQGVFDTRTGKNDVKN